MISIILLLFLIIGMGGFLWNFRVIRRKEEEPIQQTPKPKIIASSGSDDFPLQRGSKGLRVKTLQQALKERYGCDLGINGVDGDFGPITEGALIAKGFSPIVDSTLYAKILSGQVVSKSVVPPVTAINYHGLSVQLREALKSAFTDNVKVKDLLNPTRNAGYLKSLMDSYDSDYEGKGTLIKDLRNAQEFGEFEPIINKLLTL